MNWYKKSQSEIEIEGVTDNIGDIDFNLSNQATQLATNIDLGITRDRELYRVVKDLTGNVIAALWISFENRNYEFDVDIAKEHQGKRIGSALINRGIEEFEQGPYSEIDNNATMKLYVTSDISKVALKRRGFRVIKKLPSGNAIMERI